MASSLDNPAARASFLATPRLAILVTHRKADAPIGIPVWFNWTGEQVQMFAAKDSPKVRRLRTNPHASVLVTNHIGEPEAWIAFDGEVTISAGAAELIQLTGPRYWDMSNPELSKTLEQWVAAEDTFVQLTLTPTAIRCG